MAEGGIEAEAGRRAAQARASAEETAAGSQRLVAACFDHVAAARQFTHDTERARAGLAESRALLARAGRLTR
jgi:hypothetical protein